MISLIKWSAILLTLTALIYGGRLYLELNEQEREKVKVGAVDAWESGILQNPLAEKIKADWADDKQTGFIAGIKNRIKGIFSKETADSDPLTTSP